jgi:uncharacterized membrane protein
VHTLSYPQQNLSIPTKCHMTVSKANVRELGTFSVILTLFGTIRSLESRKTCALETCLAIIRTFPAIFTRLSITREDWNEIKYATRFHEITIRKY